MVCTVAYTQINRFILFAHAGQLYIHEKSNGKEDWDISFVLTRTFRLCRVGTGGCRARRVYRMGSSLFRISGGTKPQSSTAHSEKRHRVEHAGKGMRGGWHHRQRQQGTSCSRPPAQQSPPAWRSGRKPSRRCNTPRKLGAAATR